VRVRETRTDADLWWRRPGLDVRDGRLTIAGRDAEDTARRHGTPLYAYDLVYPREQTRALQRAMRRAEVDDRVRFALKAQREPAFLAALRSLGGPGSRDAVGMDVCSPGELRWAIDNDFGPGEISHTGTNLSDRDLDRILPTGCHLNVDLLSQLERVGRRAPGIALGIRVNPRSGASLHATGESSYAGSKPTKFGIYAERLEEAVDVAARFDLTIDTVHVHSGYLYLDDQLTEVEETVRRVAEMTAFLQGLGCPIVEVNTGGGLGVPFRPGDLPLDLDAWAAIMARHLAPLGVAVGTEPGEFIAKGSGTLLTEVVTVEDRDGVAFVGVDAGWNIACEHFAYLIPFHPILCRSADAPPADRVTVSGHINEGNDLFAEDWPMPDVREGDIVAIPNVGSYNASMTSEHCLRGPAAVVTFDDRIDR
jgi:diaminopimelate decarboxylase